MTQIACMCTMCTKQLLITLFLFRLACRINSCTHSNLPRVICKTNLLDILDKDTLKCKVGFLKFEMLMAKA